MSCSTPTTVGVGRGPGSTIAGMAYRSMRVVPEMNDDSVDDEPPSMLVFSQNSEMNRTSTRPQIVSPGSTRYMPGECGISGVDVDEDRAFATANPVPTPSEPPLPTSMPPPARDTSTMS